MTGTQAAPGLGNPLFLALLLSVEELLAYCFGSTRPAIPLVQGSASLIPQHSQAAQQTLHRCWERGERNQCSDPEWYLPREGTSNV